MNEMPFPVGHQWACGRCGEQYATLSLVLTHERFGCVKHNPFAEPPFPWLGCKAASG